MTAGTGFNQRFLETLFHADRPLLRGRMNDANSISSDCSSPSSGNPARHGKTATDDIA